MQVIQRGQSNTMCVTLREKQTLTAPYWLVRFVNESSLQENSCIASDTSQYTLRYNALTVTESNTQNRTSGTLTLQEGIWTYYIYEQSSASNLDYALSTTLCEVGQVRVVEADEQQISFPSFTSEYAWTTQ